MQPRLSDRLKRLVEERVLEPVPHPARPRRYEYRLTEKGADRFTALNALREGGDRYLSAVPMRLLRRRDDEAPVVAAAVPAGTRALGNDELELVPGPALRASRG